MISEFTKEKVFWTKKMNVNLVNFMKRKPNIWNPKHPKYTSVYFRDKTYAEFASKYGNEFTSQAVKDRWTNIRSTFSNYLRKVKASPGKGDGEVYKVNWHLWDACSFLLKVNKYNKSNGDGSCKDELKFQHETTDQEVSSNEEDNFSDAASNHNSACENLANSIAHVFKGIQNGIYSAQNTKYEQIGNMIYNKLSQMSSFNAAQLSSKIMVILLLYDENNPENPNNINIKHEDFDVKYENLQFNH